MGSTRRVIILGGGLAGLAAAVRLAEAGHEVQLIERRSVLGGRASSFVPPGESEPIDNCQHVLLGCCTNLLDFLRRVGTASQFRFYSRFLFLGPSGVSPVSAAALPAPLHLLPSLVQFRDLDWADRWAIARAMWAILRTHPSAPEEPLLPWLRRRGQTPRAIKYFWRGILTSALNEDLERLTTRHAFQVFRESFLINRRGYRMGVPTVPLSGLYSSQIISRHSRLRLATAATSLELADGRVSAVILQDGTRTTADFYISALPPESLIRLFPEKPGNSWPEMEEWKQFQWSPITGIHLWFDRPVMNLDHVTVLHHTIQWVFNRSAIGGQPGNPNGSQYLQLVVSASRDLLPMRREQILELCLSELAEMFPESRSATLLKSVVVKESRATLSLSPGSEAMRPGPQTPFPNLFLAGDWTATGWPPTMEGAVRSGYRAAELVADAAGNPQAFLQPDLPADPLARLLARF